MAPYSDIQPPVQGVPVDQHNQTPIAGQQVYPQVNQQVNVSVPQPRPAARAVPVTQGQPVQNGPRVEQGYVTTHGPAPNYGAATHTGQDPSNPTQGVVPQSGDRFPAKTRWVDVPWAIIFLIHTAAFFGLVIWKASECFKNGESPWSKMANSSSINYTIEAGKVVAFCAAAMVIGLIFGFVILIASTKFATVIIWLGVVLTCAVSIGFMIWFIAIGLYWSAIVFGLMFVITIIYAICIRRSIALAGALIGGASRAVIKNWGMQIMALGQFVHFSVYVGAVYLWGSSLIQQFEVEADGDGFGWFLLIWGLFALYWLWFVMLNVLHTTYSGSCARFFYMGANQCDHPTARSLKLALTKYLGAAAFGGFLLAVIAWLKALCRMAEGSARENGNIVGAILACICLCFLNCLEEIFRIVNEFALVYVSIYGNGFWKSGKMVFKLAKNTGLEPLWNDSAIGYFRFSCGLLSFCASFGLLGLFSKVVWGGDSAGTSADASNLDMFSVLSALGGDNGDSVPWVIFVVYGCGMVITMLLTLAIIQPLDSGAKCLLVIFMEAPAYFYQNHQKVYEKIRDRAAKLGLVSKAPAHFIYN